MGRRSWGASTVVDHPMVLALETSYMCNFHCAKCAFRVSKRKRGLMDTGLALDLIGQAAEMKVPRICLSLLGEPLMHPELETLASRCAELKVFSHFTTNGSRLTPERSEKLVKSGISNISVSFDGWDKESYESRMGDVPFEEILENVKAFRRIRGGKATPTINAMTVADKQMIPRLDKVARFMARNFDGGVIVPLFDYGDPDFRLDPEWLPGRKSWRRQPCVMLWTNLVVGWEGTVNACCNDHNFRLDFHDAKKAKLAEIWNSEPIKRWRRLHMEGKFDRMPMCGPCTHDWGGAMAFFSHKARFEKALAKYLGELGQCAPAPPGTCEGEQEK